MSVPTCYASPMTHCAPRRVNPDQGLEGVGRGKKTKRMQMRLTACNPAAIFKRSRTSSSRANRAPIARRLRSRIRHCTCCNKSLGNCMRVGANRSLLNTRQVDSGASLPRLVSSDLGSFCLCSRARLSIAGYRRPPIFRARDKLRQMRDHRWVAPHGLVSVQSFLGVLCQRGRYKEQMLGRR